MNINLRVENSLNHDIKPSPPTPPPREENRFLSTLSSSSSPKGGETSFTLYSNFPHGRRTKCFDYEHWYSQYFPSLGRGIKGEGERYSDRKIKLCETILRFWGEVKYQLKRTSFSRSPFCIYSLCLLSLSAGVIWCKHFCVWLFHLLTSLVILFCNFVLAFQHVFFWS